MLLTLWLLLMLGGCPDIDGLNICVDICQERQDFCQREASWRIEECLAYAGNAEETMLAEGVLCLRDAYEFSGECEEDFVDCTQSCFDRAI